MTTAEDKVDPTRPGYSNVAASTECCIVGGGPAGMVLGYILAQRGIDVTLLEAQKDFDRDFRGDAIFPWVLELMEQLGLIDGLFKIAHKKVKGYTYETSNGPVLITDYSCLKTKYPYVTVIPQNQLLDFIATKAASFPNFHLKMNANVKELIFDNGNVTGVRYFSDGQSFDLRAAITVGADGRKSRIRELGGFEKIELRPSRFDVLWFRLPHLAEEGSDANQKSFFGPGYYVSFVDRIDTWQVAYTIQKGSYPNLRAAGLESFRKSVIDLAPQFKSHMESITEWSQVKLLVVETSRVESWYRSGLLLIGDAAHVMSSIGGVGIMCAMQDAVEAANVLVQPLKSRQVSVKHLAEVQRRREWPTRIMQFLQYLVECQYVKRVFQRQLHFRAPFAFRVPGMNWLTARVTAYGVRPIRLKV